MVVLLFLFVASVNNVTPINTSTVIVIIYLFLWGSQVSAFFLYGDGIVRLFSLFRKQQLETCASSVGSQVAKFHRFGTFPSLVTRVSEVNLMEVFGSQKQSRSLIGHHSKPDLEFTVYYDV